MSKNILSLTMHSRAGAELRGIHVSALVIAGWTGRDTAALEKHIAELEAIGVARPATTPIFYRVSSARLTTAGEIEVIGTESSGEVEYVLLKHDGRLWVGVGSDHTDRKAETYGVTLSKQMCDKPMAEELWPLVEVAGHWDRLVLRSWAVNGKRRELYQEGEVAGMLDPQTLIGKYEATDGAFAEDNVMFCGTHPAKGGVRAAERFEFELEDPVLGRRIRHGYAVRTLPILG